MKGRFSWLWAITEKIEFAELHFESLSLYNILLVFFFWHPFREIGHVKTACKRLQQSPSAGKPRDRALKFSCKVDFAELVFVEFITNSISIGGM